MKIGTQKLLLFFLVVVLSINCWHTEGEKLKKQAKPFYQEALDYKRSGDFEKMKEALEKAIDIYPAYALAHMKYQKILKDEKESGEIISYYKNLMDKNPNEPVFHFLYGRLLPDLAEQKKQYKRAIELDPKNPWGYYGLGWLYFQKRRYDDAIAQYKQAVKLSPNNAYFHNNLGGAYFYRGFYQKAIKELKKAIDLDETYASPYKNLASVYYKRGDFDSAINMLETYVNLAPNADDTEQAKKQLKQLRGY